MNKEYVRGNAKSVLASILLIGLGVSASTAVRAEAVLVDAQAEPETQALFLQLQRLAKTNILFGHQDSTAYGVGWKAEPNRSDVKSATGAYPAVYGWDFANVRQPEREMSGELCRKLVIEAYRRGGVNTFSWHMFNPVTGKNFYDTTPAVAAILPGGEKHPEYKNSLDVLATFAHSLEGRDETRHVPIIFRPFHEHLGNWFWWGRQHCTTEEYVALWRFTVEYLRDEKGVHNFLYAYSPNIAYGRDNEGLYLERYPGDDYVDILGLDAYVKNMGDVLGAVREIVEMARERGKVAALTETGYPGGLSKTSGHDWYTRMLLEPLKSDPIAQGIAYVLVWRNLHKEHFWVPYPDHPGADDFRAFHADAMVLFEDALPDVYAISHDAQVGENPKAP